MYYDHGPDEDDIEDEANALWLIDAGERQLEF